MCGVNDSMEVNIIHYFRSYLYKCYRSLGVVIVLESLHCSVNAAQSQFKVLFLTIGPVFPQSPGRPLSPLRPIGPCPKHTNYKKVFCNLLNTYRQAHWSWITLYSFLTLKIRKLSSLPHSFCPLSLQKLSNMNFKPIKQNYSFGIQ